MKIVAVLMVWLFLAAPGCKDEPVPKPKTAAVQGYVFDMIGLLRLEPAWPVKTLS